MLGARKFQQYGFTLLNVSKGKNAWKEFDAKLMDIEYEKINPYTKKFAQVR